MTNTEHLSIGELSELIRAEAKKVSEGSIAELNIAAVSFREAGIEAGVHVGRSDLDKKENMRARLEWFAGQLIEIANNQSFFAVNSWVNCAEKFTNIEDE